MERIRILGIAGSPRHGNTEIAVKEALAGAAQLSGVETDFETLGGKRINPCLSMRHCWTSKGTKENPCPEWGPNDELSILIKKAASFDGYILGTPVYNGGVSAQLKSFLDRITEVAYGGELLAPLGLRNRVVGAVCAGSFRNGGEELAIIDIWRWTQIMDMIMVSPGPNLTIKINPFGGCITETPTPEGFKWARSMGSTEELQAANEDRLGLLSCREVGKRVAEMTRVIKAGFQTLPPEATFWPYGATSGRDKKQKGT